MYKTSGDIWKWGSRNLAFGDVPKICEDLKITSEKYKVRVEKAQISGRKNMSPKVNISKMKESRLVDAFP